MRQVEETPNVNDSGDWVYGLTPESWIGISSICPVQSVSGVCHIRFWMIPIYTDEQIALLNWRLVQKEQFRNLESAALTTQLSRHEDIREPPDLNILNTTSYNTCFFLSRFTG
jgi:hypothetical protein